MSIKKPFLRYLVLSVLLMGLAPSVTKAASFTVTSTADDASSISNPHTLRGAIAASQASPDASDTIAIAVTGTITLTQGELLLSNPKTISGKTVSLTGPGAGLFAIDGNNSGGTTVASHILHVTAGTVTVHGITLTDGNNKTDAKGGAGVLLEGATLTLDHCVVSSCSSQSSTTGGAGVSNFGGVLTLQNSVIASNQGLSGPGGIGSSNGALTVRNSTVDNNLSYTFSHPLGGGIASSGDVLTIANSHITANQAGSILSSGISYGGGLYLVGDQATITDCTIDGNAASVGQGIFVSGAAGKTVRLAGCTLTNNGLGGADATGVGFSLYTTGAVSLTNCTVYQNGAGGVYNSGMLTVADSTITNNDAYTSGVGGLYNDASGTATVTSTILAANGGQNVLSVTPGAIKSGGSNLIGDPDGNGFVNDPHHADPNSTGNHDQTGVTKPGLDILNFNNGGPTPTYALTAGSPAIDADFADATPTDQRGAPRPFGVRNDIGAFEYGATPPAVTLDTYVVTNTNDSGPGSLRWQVAEANADPGSVVSFDPAVFGPGKPQMITLTTGEIPITQTVTIIGPGADLLAVSGNDASQVFSAGGAGAISISGLTITHGKVVRSLLEQSFVNGGGLGISGDVSLTDCIISHCTVTAPDGTNSGGGIYVQSGDVSLTRCAITDCSAPGGSGGGIGMGTPIQIYLTLTNCTVSGNSAGVGGGLQCPYPSSSIILLMSTVSGNTATTGGGIDSVGILSVVVSTVADNTATTGGGINMSGGAFVTNSATIAGNTAATGGGVNLSSGVTAICTNSIFAGNTGGNFVKASSVPVTSEGNNLSGDPNGNGFTNGVNHDITGVTNPKLGSLQDNGGPTPTMALLPGSPAIDAGPTTMPGATQTDQRGVTRPQGAAYDIGAYEYGAPVARDDGYIVQENKTLAVQAPGVLADDTADGSSPKLTATLEDKPLHGSLMFNHDGSFSYTPNTDFLGTDTFTYEAADAGVAGTIGTVTLTVTNITPPTTIATLNPATPNGLNSYYTVPVTIMLTATAASNDTSTGTTFYTLDGSAQKTYTTPIKVSTDGHHTLTYFSQTPLGGAEASHTLTFAIDATPPVTTATKAAVTGGTQIMLSAKDPVSGIASTVYTIDSGAQQTYTAPFTVSSTAAHTIVYHSTDKAGNIEKAQTITVASGTLHTFATGLQMFSVPADYSSLSLGDSLVQSGTTSAPTLAVWVPSMVNYVLSPTAPADHLRPGQGYWVRLNGTGSLSSMGTPTPTSTPFSITLGEGWNMIGDPFASTISLANVVVMAGGKTYTGIAPASSAGVIGYLIYSYPAGSSAYVSENGTGNLSPYLGYWVYTFQPCTLTITAP